MTTLGSMLRCYPQQGLNMIEPKVLKGFRDSLPQQEIVRQKLMAKVQQILRSFGFVPIDTPALEYTEVLLGKGG